MNMLVIEQGPEISMPGLWSSAGTGGTRQAPVVAALGRGRARRRAGPAAGVGALKRGVAGGDQVVDTRAEPVVQGQQEVGELRSEQLRRALDGRNANSAEGHPGSPSMSGRGPRRGAPLRSTKFFR